jgi:acetylornithine deacetylase/succinyl-diaminopimelate desuccinylase-like protein
MEEVTKLAKELIAIPSVSGGEAEILKFCADWFRGAEFDDVFTDDMFTAGVVRAANGAASRALILCGHVDTVAPGAMDFIIGLSGICRPRQPKSLPTPCQMARLKA